VATTGGAEVGDDVGVGDNVGVGGNVGVGWSVAVGMGVSVDVSGGGVAAPDSLYLINNPGETNSRRRHLPKMPNTGTLRNLC